ncbi:MAG: SipW-dependent-type signal peptide-containing protein [Clostridia bacterium]|nr:SipW-dependent-type signal peptide-containing protein [Clostridia bacterium]
MKSKKSALLMSFTSLLLCFAMLAGSTFAWFTDTATTGVNQIKSGTLKVDIQNEAGDSLRGKTLRWVVNGRISENNVLWEPNCTYELESFKIVNRGNLALKYQITINGVTGDAKLLEAIEFTAKIGNDKIALDQLTGAILPKGAAVKDATKEVVEKTELITISGHMKQDAGNQYQNLTIDGIGITVVATQYTYESDSISDQYDANADYTIQVNKDNIQDYLDGKYGSIDGMTLVLAAGSYDKIEFGRATAYAGSNTKYYLKGSETTVDAIKQAIAANPHGGAGTPVYVRSMSNVTLKAADDAVVTINGLVAFGGQVNSTKWYSRDFVADRVANDNNTSYYIEQKWSNITFEGLTFTDGVNIEAYERNTLINNVKFDNCKFNVSDTDTNKTNCIRLNVDGNQAKANNLVVANCEFTDGYTAVLTDGMPNVTVTGSTFSGLTKHAISLMMGMSGAPGYGRITVTGNTFSDMSSEFKDGQPAGVILRMGKVGAGAVFTIQNNTATGNITLANSIKVDSLADGITYHISENSWGSSLTASDPKLND